MPSNIDKAFIENLQNFTDSLEGIVELLKEQSKKGDAINQMLSAMDGPSMSEIAEDIKTLVEKTDKKFGNYFELSAQENNKDLKIVLSKQSIESQKFNWSYYSNPLDENSYLVERSSDINGFIKDVEDIFEKNRFDSDYLEKLN